MLYFHPEAERASQPTARIDGIDRAFLFGNAWSSGPRQGCTPFSSRLEDIRVSRGLALLYILSTNIYLGVKATPGSYDEGTITLTPGWRIEIPSLCVLRVSAYLDDLGVYCTDICEGNGPVWAYFVPFLTLRIRGVKITKTAIAPDRVVRSFRPFGHLF